MWPIVHYGISLLSLYTMLPYPGLNSEASATDTHI